MADKEARFRRIGVYVDARFDDDVAFIARRLGVKVNQHLSEIVRDAVRLYADREAARDVAKGG